MGCEAVFATVGFGHCNGDLFPELCTEFSAAERAKSGLHHFQRGGGVRDGFEHIRSCPKSVVDRRQDLLLFAGCGVGLDHFDSAHFFS